MAGVSRELQLTLQSAYREAVHRRHAYVTIEHLLFALLHDERGVEIVRSCGGQVDVLKRDLERFFREDLEEVPGDETVEAISIEGAESFALGVQWHAEYDAVNDPVNRALFAAFGAAARTVVGA